MSKYRKADYQQIVRNMPTQEIDSLFETFQNCTTRTAVETEVMTILEARKIRNEWNRQHRHLSYDL